MMHSKELLYQLCICHRNSCISCVYVIGTLVLAVYMSQELLF